MADTPPLDVQFRYTLGDQFRSGAIMSLQTVSNIIWILLFPLMAVTLIGSHLYFGKPLELVDMVLVMLLLSFHPLMLTYHALKAHVLSKRKGQPFHYQFGDFGVRAFSDIEEIKHSWKAICKVKRQGGFLLLFFTPGVAHCLPYRQLSELGVVEQIVDLARAHGVRVRGV